MILARMTRADLEVAILEEEILDVSSPAALEAIGRMTDAELRAAVQSWIEAGDECGNAGGRTS